MKNILVTGGLGYIGSHTVIELLSNSNYNVVVIDDLSNSDKSIIDRIRKISNRDIKVYIRDCRYDIDDVFQYNKIDSVIHFAAYKSVGESVINPLEYYDNNINSLLNILKSCKKYGIKNIVFSSSCSLYGDVDKLPVNENTPLSDPQSPYAYTKLVGERIISDFCKVNPMFDAISLRYFNPVGAHKSGLIGEYPINKPNNIVPVICNSAQTGDEMVVFGDTYNTRDGSCIRDYIHVSDIATAHILALEYMINGTDKNYEVFNLGSESGVSVLELIKTFEDVNKVKVNYKVSGKRDGDVVQIYSDSTRARNILCWIPRYNIEDMVSTAWRWYNV